MKFSEESDMLIQRTLHVTTVVISNMSKTSCRNRGILTEVLNIKAGETNLPMASTPCQTAPTKACTMATYTGNKPKYMVSSEVVFHGK